MSIKVPFNIPQAVQAAIAFLGAVGAVGTQFLHDTNGFLPGSWAAGITSVLAVIAAVSGFLEKAEPLIDDLS